jgi:ribosomal protein S18 acetylase RimI-like enzyme
VSPNDSLQPAARRASTLTIRRFTPDEWWLYRDLRLRALQDSPDAFGSTYAQECHRTDSDWGTRLARGATSRRDLPLLAEVNGEPGGLAWVRIEEDALSVAHLYQMWVAPDRRGQGVGRALLDAAVEWARTAGTHALMLDVTVSNGPALHLYERAGFVAIGDPKPLRPGSSLQSRSMQLSFTSGSAKASDAERCLHRSRD